MASENFIITLYLVTSQGNSNPESHAQYVWKHFISKWPGKVAVVAHSAGGYVTVEMVGIHVLKSFVICSFLHHN